MPTDISPDASQAELMNMLMQWLGISALIGLISLVISIIIWWSIFSKAGFSGARSLLLLIPIVGIIIFLMFAFGEWPLRREVETLRQENAALRQQMGMNPSYPHR